MFFFILLMSSQFKQFGDRLIPSTSLRGASKAFIFSHFRKWIHALACVISSGQKTFFPTQEAASVCRIIAGAKNYQMTVDLVLKNKTVANLVYNFPRRGERTALATPDVNIITK